MYTFSFEEMEVTKLDIPKICRIAPSFIIMAKASDTRECINQSGLLTLIFFISWTKAIKCEREIKKLSHKQEIKKNKKYGVLN